MDFGDTAASVLRQVADDFQEPESLPALLKSGPRALGGSALVQPWKAWIPTSLVPDATRASRFGNQPRVNGQHIESIGKSHSAGELPSGPFANSS